MAADAPARRRDLVEREVDGARLLLGEGAGPHLLDPLGAALFDLLDGRTPVDELAEDLAAALEQPLEQAGRSLAGYLDDLRVRGLLDDGDLPGPQAPRAAPPGGVRYPAVPPSP